MKRSFVNSILDDLQAVPVPEETVWDDESFEAAWHEQEYIPEDGSWAAENAPELYRLPGDGEKQWQAPGGARVLKLLEQRFLADYAEYVSGDEGMSKEWEEELEQKLMVLLQKLTAYVIHRRICCSSVYHSDDEMTIVQEGHFDAFLSLRTDRQKRRMRTDPLAFYRRIYKNKTADYFRSYGLYASNAASEDEKKADRTGTVRKRDIACAGSLEALVKKDDGDSMMDSFRPLGVRDDHGAASRSARGNRQVLTVYLQELLEYDRKPSGPLAVMYARILYQMERILDPEAVDRELRACMEQHGWSTDPEDRHYAMHLTMAGEKIQQTRPATDPVWAMERMGDRTIRLLLADSEGSLHRLFDRSLFWGALIRGDLEDRAGPAGELLLGDLVYTGTYSKSRIEHWAADIHKTMVIRSAKSIRKQPELLEFVMEEMRGDGKLKTEIRSQIEKELERSAGKRNKKEAGGK